MSGLHEITAGFMPLLDSALVVVAKTRGFAEEEGVAFRLVRQTSWANIRDRSRSATFRSRICSRPCRSPAISA